MKRMIFAAVFALLPLLVASCGLDGDSDDVTIDVPEEETAIGDVEESMDVEVLPGPCLIGDSDGLFRVRVADSLDNVTLTGDCGAGNPGADIDAIVLLRPNGDEFFAETVAEDTDVVGGVCDQNDKDDISTVTGQPDACAKDLGCGCGENGYPENPDCDCAGGDNKWVGYYSLNGGAIIVTFDGDVELLCGDVVTVYEMYNQDVAGSEEGFSVSYGDENGNWREESDYASGNADVDVTWDW